MLVLDTTIGDVPDAEMIQSTSSASSCLHVIIICPSVKHVESLRRDCGADKLREDLEQHLLCADLLDELNTEIDAIRLDVQLDINELEQTEVELHQ